MKWYSEEELKKWLGHSITLSLLEQMQSKNLYLCSQCSYWTPRKEKFDMGLCCIFGEYTHSDDPCYNAKRRK